MRNKAKEGQEGHGRSPKRRRLFPRTCSPGRQSPQQVTNQREEAADRPSRYHQEAAVQAATGHHRSSQHQHSSVLKPTFLLAAARTAPSLLHSDSKFLVSHHLLSDFSKLDLSLSSRTSFAIKARGAFNPFKGSRSLRDESDDEADDEADKALDLSTLRSSSVRLIDQDQKMVGVVPLREAEDMAEAADLDLVIISPEADPPVVKIMDYDKYRYEQQKKKRGQQKKTIATRVDVKELKMGYNIEAHDYAVRLKAARKFLTEGHKVKMIVSLKGRENIFKNDAIQLMRRFQNDVGELATEEATNLRDKNIFIILVPNKALAQRIQESAKKEGEAGAKPDEAEAKLDEAEPVNEVSAGV